MSRGKMKAEVDTLHFEAEPTNDVYIEYKLKERIQKRLDEGWTFRSSVTLEGRVYLMFVGKFKDQ